MWRYNKVEANRLLALESAYLEYHSYSKLNARILYPLFAMNLALVLWAGQTIWRHEVDLIWGEPKLLRKWLYPHVGVFDNVVLNGLIAHRLRFATEVNPIVTVAP